MLILSFRPHNLNDFFAKIQQTKNFYKIHEKLTIETKFKAKSHCKITENVKLEVFIAFEKYK